MTTVQYLRQNSLLDLLPVNDFERLTPHLERVRMAQGEIIFESGDQLRYAYFPLTCVISLVSIMENGSLFEIAVIGN
jgi:CRP-like cAMP-binding protein